MAHQEHIHKYKAVVLGGKKIVKRDGVRYIETTGGYPVYKCMLPRCTHYIARELAVGRSSICWKCGAELIMNARNLQQVKPKHRDCAESRSNVA